MSWQIVGCIIGGLFIAFVVLHGFIRGGTLHNWDYERNVWDKLKALWRVLVE